MMDLAHVSIARGHQDYARSVALGIASTMLTLGLMAIVVALIYRVGVVRTTVMKVMHRLTGQ